MQATPQTFVKDIFLPTSTYERSERAIPLLYKPGKCIKLNVPHRHTIAAQDIA